MTFSLNFFFLQKYSIYDMYVFMWKDVTKALENYLQYKNIFGKVLPNLTFLNVNPKNITHISNTKGDHIHHV